MLVKKIIHSDMGVMILSFLIGLGLATLFKKTCQGPTCRSLEYRVPENIDGQIFYLGSSGSSDSPVPEKPECFRYNSYAVHCPRV